jgi:hypothetical protein
LGDHADFHRWVEGKGRNAECQMPNAELGGAKGVKGVKV